MEPNRYIAGGDDGRIIAPNAFIGVVGDNGYLEVGEESIAVCGFSGTAITGEKGIAIADIGGVLQAGEDGALVFSYLDKEKGRVRFKTGYIGEEGLYPNQFYTLNFKNEIVPYFHPHFPNSIG